MKHCVKKITGFYINSLTNWHFHSTHVRNFKDYVSYVKCSWEQKDCNFTLYWSSLYDTDYRYVLQFMSLCVK